MPSEIDSRPDKQAARQVVDVFHEISALLNADLDRQTLSICISLIENGVNPEALASVIRELKRDAEEVRKDVQSENQNEARAKLLLCTRACLISTETYGMEKKSHRV